MAESPDYDVVIAGGGLRGSMAAIALSRLRPQTRLLLVDRSTRFGGERIEPFQLADIPATQRWMIETSIVRSWKSYYVAFPGLSRKIGGDIALVMPEQIHADVVDSLRPDQWRLETVVARCDADGIVLVDGARIGSRTVLDFTRHAAPPNERAEVQEVISHEVRFDRPHPLDTLVLIDATFDSLVGSAFLQYIPLSRDLLEIRHIRHGAGGSERAFDLPNVIQEGGRVVRSDRTRFPLGAAAAPAVPAGRFDGPIRFDARAFACDPALPSPVPAALMAAAALSRVKDFEPDQVRCALAAVEGQLSAQAEMSMDLARFERPSALRLLRSVYS